MENKQLDVREKGEEGGGGGREGMTHSSGLDSLAYLGEGDGEWRIEGRGKH